MGPSLNRHLQANIHNTTRKGIWLSRPHGGVLLILKRAMHTPKQLQVWPLATAWFMEGADCRNQEAHKLAPRSSRPKYSHIPTTAVVSSITCLKNAAKSCGQLSRPRYCMDGITSNRCQIYWSVTGMLAVFRGHSRGSCGSLSSPPRSRGNADACNCLGLSVNGHDGSLYNFPPFWEP